jgi:hypothetical protein
MENPKSNFDELFAQAENMGLQDVGNLVDNMGANASVEDVSAEVSNVVDIDLEDNNSAEEKPLKKTKNKTIDFSKFIENETSEEKEIDEEEKDYTKETIKNWCETSVALLNMAIPKGAEFVGKNYFNKNVNSKNIELTRTEEKKLAKSLEPTAVWLTENVGEMHPLLIGFIAIISAFGFSIVTEFSTAENLNKTQENSENTSPEKRKRGRPRKVNLSEAV